MTHYTNCFLLFCIFLALTNNSNAQITAGQILVNGNISHYENHAVTDREFPGRTDGGEFIPGLTYQNKQSAYNSTFAPEAHYFLSQKWSIGLGFGLRRIVTNRYVPHITVSEPSDYIAIGINTKNKTTTYSYAPRLEVARHWYIGQRLAINLTAFTSLQIVTIKRENSLPLELTKIENVENWTVSENGLRFSPQHNELETIKDKDQFWRLGVQPQLRYAFTPRFGMTAIIGILDLSQEFKSTTDNFVKARPELSLSINPTSWTWGLYYVFGVKETD